MDSVTLGSGDTHRSQPGSPSKEEKATPNTADKDTEATEETEQCREQKTLDLENITPQAIQENESQLKNRISQCRNIIESLKLELNEEKAKLERSTTSQQESYTSQTMETTVETLPTYAFSNDSFGEFSMNTDMYSACVDSKLNYDENLIEYEKQLEKYQDTLNRAQIEKKNAIRRQMLTKAYRFKLLELENQCNMELLRVKQSLQCLEPLQMIANKWKTEVDEGSYDLNKFELMPAYPEIDVGTSSGAEVKVVKEEVIEPEDNFAEDVVSKLSE